MDSANRATMNGRRRWAGRVLAASILALPAAAASAVARAGGGGLRGSAASPRTEAERRLDETETQRQLDESLTPTTSARKPPKWYPSEIDGVRKCTFDDGYPNFYLVTQSTYLFDDERECCTEYRVCPPTTVAATAEKEEFWHPVLVDGAPVSCVKDADYPEDYLDLRAFFLFDTQDLCCQAHPATCPNAAKWYPEAVDGSMMCVFGEGYPQQFVDKPEGNLFESEEECCGHYSVCEADGADATPLEAVSTTTATTTTTAPTSQASSTLTTTPLSDATSPTAVTTALATTKAESTVPAFTSIPIASTKATQETTPPEPEPEPEPEFDLWQAVGGRCEGTSYSEAQENGPLFGTHFECCRAFSTCPDRWLPMTVNGVKVCIYGTEYMMYSNDVMTRDSQEECCAAHGCDDLAEEEKAAAEAAASEWEAATVLQADENTVPFWWPVYPDNGGQLKCEYSTDYPADIGYLSQTEYECCSYYHACPQYWWASLPDGGAAPSCVYSSGYPPDYGLFEVSVGIFLFETREECCMMSPPGACGEDTTEVAPDEAQPALDAPAPAPATSDTGKAVKWYPEEVDGVQKCVHGNEWPDAYRDESWVALFDSQVECCSAFRVC